MMPPSLAIAELAKAYEEGTLDPHAVLNEVYRRILERGLRPVWITLVPKEKASQKLREVIRRLSAGETLPLFGIPFAVKDNIDVAGLPTTAGCPDFAYVAQNSASVVTKLEAAGAILIGKTNLDQFATGLVGTRSPYGVCASVFNDDYISGGSSSGSAVAVGAGLVSFSLGTDTAGSGRVPAAFNNIVGLKPTKGLVSTRGVVPACRTIDCISIFAGSVDDAVTVLNAAEGFDADDPYSRPAPNLALPRLGAPVSFRFGVPESGLEFFGDHAAETLYFEAIARLERLGGSRVGIDFTPFSAAARLLYGGAWVAERLAALGSFGFTPDASMDPTVRTIIEGGAGISAADAFQGFYELAAHCRSADKIWAKVDVMLLPTTGTIYSIKDVVAEPVKLNTTLGFYTNFVNLMDLSAIAIPAGLRPNGLPFGVSLIGRAFEDRRIAGIADLLHRAWPAASIGATGVPLAPPLHTKRALQPNLVALAVVGAHLTGEPLNWQLTSRGAVLARTTRTGAGYSLYSLDGTVPAKPGLVFDGRGNGFIEVEIWHLDFASFGSFVAEIPPPLGVGTLVLEDGTTVKGFLCESHAVNTATDITRFGGWRNWRSSVSL